MIEASRIGTHGNAHPSDPWQVWLVGLKFIGIADCTSTNQSAVAVVHVFVVMQDPGVYCGASRTFLRCRFVTVAVTFHNQPGASFTSVAVQQHLHLITPKLAWAKQH